MRWLCDTRLPAARTSAARARALVAGLDLPIDDAAREDLRLLVSEVTTNALRHGSTQAGDAQPSVRMRVGLESDRVRVEIQDDGPGFVPRARGPRSALDSGWGVHFVRELAHRWGTGHAGGGWTVWFELRVPPARGGGSRVSGSRADHARDRQWRAGESPNFARRRPDDPGVAFAG